MHGEEKIGYITNLLSKTHNEIEVIDSHGLRESTFLNKIFSKI